MKLKYEVIKTVEKEPKIGVRKHANLFNCGKTQISMILRNGERIVELYEANAADVMYQMRKRIRGSTISDVNEALYDWFHLRSCLKERISRWPDLE